MIHDLYRGNLEVIKYLYEQCHENIGTKDNYGLDSTSLTPENGHLEDFRFFL